jgi:hypothetical protein
MDSDKPDRLFLVDTEMAVTFIARPGEDPRFARARLYEWRKEGKIRNHGSGKRGRARWDLRELKKVVQATIDKRS